MSHTIEAATSGRAKCRGCGQAIDKGALRFGERVDNPYGEGDRTLWFHVPCGALKRSEPFLEAAAEPGQDPEALEPWLAEAQAGVTHHRLTRIDGAEQAPSGRARCRACRELIEKGAWRIPLVFWAEARFESSGFIHTRCADSYFGTHDVLSRISHFAPDLSEEQLRDICTETASEPQE